MLALVQLVLAGAAAAGAGLAWVAAGSLEVAAPVLEGEPSKSSMVYNPGLIALALILATGAGLLAVSGLVRLRAR